MLGIKCFICSFFLWLSFICPQEFNGVTPTFDSQADSVTSASDNHPQALILDGYLETNEANWSFETFKIPFIPNNHKGSLPSAETYDYKLLYLEIGKTIPLKLSTSKLIFPFHCFT